MKLYVGNLSFKMTLEDLKNEFSKYGAVEDAVIITDKFSGRSKGFGFITFTNDADAQKAIAELNGKEIEGRELTVNEARPMESRENSRPSEGEGNAVAEPQ
ncbi:RNA-binding protein [archaeon]|jgi:cold-inducible RNA-binding protein|nr:RNA-binding protein [archaeon]